MAGAASVSRSSGAGAAPTPRGRGGALRARAAGVVLTLAVALTGAGCGAQAHHGPLRVTSLSLSPGVGFSGPLSAGVTLERGAAFARIARLVPLPLPPELVVNPAGGRHPLTVCFPMDLAIGLSDGELVRYPSCYRPRSLRRVVAALCPLVHLPGLCALYRREL